ncbi:MAG: hypothetical protein WCR67_01750 [Bacilli bacterium]
MKEKPNNLENIQNCLDTSNLSGDENKGFKDFVDDVQKSRTSSNKKNINGLLEWVHF